MSFIHIGQRNEWYDSFYCAELAATMAYDVAVRGKEIYLYFSDHPARHHIFEKRARLASEQVVRLDRGEVRAVQEDWTSKFLISGHLANFHPIIHALIRYLRDGGTWRLAVLSAACGVIAEYGYKDPDSFVPSGVETWAKTIHPKLFWSLSKVKPRVVDLDSETDLIAGYCYFLHGDMSDLVEEEINLRPPRRQFRSESYYDEAIKWLNGENLLPLVELSKIWPKAKIRCMPMLDIIMDQVSWVYGGQDD